MKFILSFTADTNAVNDDCDVICYFASPLTACFSLGSLSNISDLDPSQAVVSDEVKPSPGAEDMIELFSARGQELPSTADEMRKNLSVFHQVFYRVTNVNN